MSLEPESVLGEMDKAVEMYHRLVLVVAPSGAGKTAVLQSVVFHRGRTTGFSRASMSYTRETSLFHP
jgi:ribose 1,5-bisphosphokinase PhnN